MEKIKDFYNKFYVSENMTVTFVGSLEYEIVRKIVYERFGGLPIRKVEKLDFKRNEFASGVYKENKIKSDTVKIQAIYDISSLTL